MISGSHLSKYLYFKICCSAKLLIRTRPKRKVHSLLDFVACVAVSALPIKAVKDSSPATSTHLLVIFHIMVSYAQVAAFFSRYLFVYGLCSGSFNYTILLFASVGKHLITCEYTPEKFRTEISHCKESHSEIVYKIDKSVKKKFWQTIWRRIHGPNPLFSD